ncbi:unnamed protein product [Porites lobata]|uniref:Uncharacterized protein n=1 Tax=Porites lobata TaxID=104759 RepID=A0ABN8NPP5_9CNID|nr:unnamed protein product [Porites lobata]
MATKPEFLVTKEKMLVALATVKGLQIYSYIEDVTQKLMESRHAFLQSQGLLFVGNHTVLQNSFDAVSTIKLCMREFG